MRLMPDMHAADEYRFALPEANTLAQLSINVLERCKYTTILALSRYNANSWAPALHVVLRVYHDAQMAEVVSFQRQRVFQARYDYPNSAMFQPDEKAQWNSFLGEWLSFCLRHGQALSLVDIDG